MIFPRTLRVRHQKCRFSQNALQSPAQTEVPRPWPKRININVRMFEWVENTQTAIIAPKRMHWHAGRGGLWVITASALGYCGDIHGGAEAICELWHRQPLATQQRRCTAFTGGGAGGRPGPTRRLTGSTPVAAATTKGGLGKHKLKALNVSAHSIGLRHRSLLLVLFDAFYNINNLENITDDCSRVPLKKKKKKEMRNPTFLPLSRLVQFQFVPMAGVSSAP